MLKLPRRNFLRLAAGATALPAMARLAKAESYPSRPVRLVVGFPPAGTTDIGARLMAAWLSDRLGQQFIVENRPGGGSSIAAEYVVRSPADGYTLLLSTVANAINTSFYQNLSFDFARDIAAVGNLFRVPLVMEINPSLPVKTVSEFVAYAKANPGKITLASAGTGTSGHISAELFAMMAGIKMVHVPYRGAGPALVDVIAGQCQVIFDLLPSSIGYVRGGRTRALAVTTTVRSEALPDIPVLADFVPGYEASAWIGIGAPRDTPSEIVDRLNQAINAGLADPGMKARFAELGGAAAPGTPAEFGKFVASETEKWSRVIKFTNIKAD
ncbi:MAG TPA: tripartite tricarboxylate transporter substrate binding protein [Xanthobacteraceae bacterium]|jgi:tripartite-type tricarboxylate transporter receptor subunit TctC